MKTSKPVMVAIEQLRVKIFVRQKLNEDHVLNLALLYEADVILPPLEITKDYDVIEGRHRLEAAKLAGKKELPCDFVDDMKPAEMIAYAFSRNVGGNLPPSKQDINFTIESLLERKTSSGAIVKYFSFWPADVVRKYIKDAQSNVLARSMAGAIKAVTEGDMRPSDAAEKFGVDAETLKTAISGKIRKRKGPELGINVLKGHISSQYRSHTQMNNKRFEKLLSGFRDHEVSESVVEGAFEHTRALAKKHLQSIDHWWERWDSIRSGVGMEEQPEDTAELGGLVL